MTGYHLQMKDMQTHRLFSKRNMDSQQRLLMRILRTLWSCQLLPAQIREKSEFYKQLRFNVQSLDTLRRLADVKGNVRCTLDKLKGIKADLVRGNEGWKDWGFKDLLRELQKWTQINPVEEIAVEKLEKDQTGKRNQQFKPPLPIFNTHQSKPRSGNQWVYCEDDNHRAINCTKVTSVHERQKILSEKNCALIAPVQDIALMSVRANRGVRSVIANITRPFVTSKKTKPIHSLSP